MSEEGRRWGLLGLAGALSLCCIGLGTLAGGAALVGGGAAGITVVSTSSTTLAGALVTGLSTAIPLLLVGLFLQHRARS